MSEPPPDYLKLIHEQLTRAEEHRREATSDSLRMFFAVCFFLLAVIVICSGIASLNNGGLWIASAILATLGAILAAKAVDLALH